MFQTHITRYGKVTLLKNDMYINGSFVNGYYWDENILLKLKQLIDPNKNILEFGGHCGTSTLVYATFLNPDNRVYVLEPQKNLYSLLKLNVEQNSLQDKVIHFNKGVFCFTGPGNMHHIDLDGSPGASVEKRYKEEANQPCNFGGIALGNDGEKIELTTIDDLNIPNLGFIHSDAQGSEPYIFWAARNTIRKHKPIIMYEKYDKFSYLGKQIHTSYPMYEEASKFDIKEFCVQQLGYRHVIPFGSENILLVP